MYRVTLKSRPAIAAALGLALAGCAGWDSPFDAGKPAPPGPSTSISDKMSSLFFGPPVKPGDPNAAPRIGQDDIGCPQVDIRAGASTLSIAASGTTASPTTLRYQATIAQTARECAQLGGTITMRVGIQGRVVLGPSGGPGQLDMPLRYALVKEGPEPKTIWTKMYKLPVTIPAGQANVPFVHVEEDLTVAVPPGNDLQSYVIYVGFDPNAPAEKPVRAKKKQKT